jgi:AcrR family transcriptional regulator
MAGLREIKQKDRHGRIAKAALELFDQQGFAATTMDMIAEKARLGVGTLYNYYPSKADLLLGIITDRAAPFEESLRMLAKKDPKNILIELEACLDSYLESFSFFSKRIWHDFIVTALARNLPLFTMIEAVDAKFLSLLTIIIGKYQKSNPSANHPKAELLVRNLYSVMLHNFMLYISIEAMSAKALKKAILCQIESIIAYSNLVLPAAKRRLKV